MSVTVSEVDNQFLKSIEGNARLSDSQLATMLGCDEASVVEMRARLEALGVIAGYRTRIKWDVVTAPAVESFIDLAVQPERGYGYDRIADRIRQFPEVVSVHLVTGSQDLRVVVRGQTMQEVASFVAERLATIDGVRGTARSQHMVSGAALLTRPRPVRYGGTESFKESESCRSPARHSPPH